ncbi:hypothetical protein, partial [Trinickia sp.]|uniref:hypothetical protein n=1 Tax=Trinickia sp. TaxID=2571163 RepID=UPI003F806E06
FFFFIFVAGFFFLWFFYFGFIFNKNKYLTTRSLFWVYHNPRCVTFEFRVIGSPRIIGGHGSRV